MGRRFVDRRDAGHALGQALRQLEDAERLLVLGLPRGGVVVAGEVARVLDAPLDVLVVRKLGVPGHEELAMGAVAGGDVRVLNPDVIRDLGIPPSEVEAATQREAREVARRERLYRGQRPAPALAGHDVILVDDGIATGATIRAAVAALRVGKPRRVILAVPVAPQETCEELRRVADEVVCLSSPRFLDGVGAFYDDFSQTPDDEVRTILGAAKRPVPVSTLEP